MFRDGRDLTRGSACRMQSSRAVPRPWLNLYRGRASPGKTWKRITFILDGQAFPFCPFQHQLPSWVPSLEILLWPALLARKKGAHNESRLHEQPLPVCALEREGEKGSEVRKNHNSKCLALGNKLLKVELQVQEVGGMQRKQ